MKIINVSYRLPISLMKIEDEIKIKTSSGGLVSAVQSLQRGNNHLSWVGVADFSRPDWLEGKNLYEDNIDLHPVFLEKYLNHNFYNGFSNSVLWPLFHYFPSYVEYRQEYIDDYSTANQIIAEYLYGVVEKDDVIWIHDYHLIPLAGYIRKLLPQAKIGFFLHIPFPSYELIRLLPKDCRDVLIKNLLGADLLYPTIF
jgi:trehalose 6-phosphate synthase/phosphatase